MKKIIFILIVIFIGIQLIPIKATNPPVSYNVKWDSEQTLSFAKRACFDCHSNETVWPWYSKLAPVSWFITSDVNDGRKKLNFSTGNLKEAIETVEEIQEDEMPMRAYLLLHPEARLTEAEKKNFIKGLRNTFGSESEQNTFKEEKD